MITAVMRYGSVPGSKVLRLNVRGHAGYRRDGNDIVCASVSITVQALASCALEMARSGEAEDAAFVSSDENGREVSLRVRADGCKSETAALAMFRQAEMALTMLATAYPDHVVLVVN